MFVLPFHFYLILFILLLRPHVDKHCLLGPKPLRRSGVTPGGFGALTYSKTLENWHTRWNLGGWDLGLAHGFYGAPWNTVRKLDVYLTHTCTYSYETRYTYRSHCAEQLSRCMS